MQTFFQAQLDFVYFFYGLSFIFLGLICFLLKRQYKIVPDWQWLGWFGLLHGLNEWADMVNLIITYQEWFAVVRLFFLMLSFACLVEFSRRDFNSRKKIQVGKWIYWLIGLILFFSWWNWGLFGINVFVRYILGVGGAIGAGFAFFRFSSSSKEHPVKFFVGAVSFWLYGLSQFIIQTGQLPLIRFTNQELFFDYFGFPIQLVRALAAVLISVMIWLYYQRAVSREFKEQQIVKGQMIGYHLLGIFVGVLVVGWLICNLLGNYAKKELIKNNENIVAVLSGSLDTLLIDGKNLSQVLSGLPGVINYINDPNKENLALVNEILDRYSSTGNLAIAYLLDKDGTTIATSNRNGPDSLLGKNYSFRPYFKEAISGAHSILFAVGVTTQKPGFYSSHPIRNHKGEIIGVAVVKINLDLIQQYFDRYELAFFVSPDGVLFLSGQPKYYLKTLSPISNLDKRRLYSLRQFDHASLEPIFDSRPKNEEVFSLEGKFFLIGNKAVNGEGWSVFVLSSVMTIGLYRLFGILITLVFCIFTTGFVILVQDIRRNIALAYLASIVYSSDDAIIGTNLKREIISWNTGAEKIYGYSKDEILGKNILVLIPKDKIPENMNILDQVMASKSANHFESIHLKKNGQIINVLLTVSATKDIIGSIVGASLMVRNISKEKMIDEAIKRSERKFIDLFNNINDIVFISDLDGRFLDFNETMVRDLGYTKQELRKMSRPDILAPEFAQMSKEGLKEIMREGFKKFETIFVTKNGITLPVEISSNLILYEGKKAILSSARDITERKLADRALKKQMTELEKFKLAADKASDAIVITDADGNILYANTASEKISGFSRKDIDSHNIGQLWGGHMEKKFYQNMWKTIKTDKKIFIGELKNRRKTGEEYYVHARFYPLLNELGEVRFFVGMETDITQAKEVDRAKSEFISVASHQLRTPLTGIKWFSELLLKGKAGNLSPEQKDFIKQVYDSNDRMIKLVDDLLDVSHIEEAGRFRIILKPEEFSSLIKTLVEDQKVQAKNKNVKIILSENCLKKIILKLDKSKIEQALQNLLSNAIKYSPIGGKVLIDCGVQKENFVCSIKDSGVGIPQYQQRRVFEKFFRADNVITVGSGTGLGLYIAKFIIEGHDGKIWFESKENKGTTFYISIPIKK